MALRQVPGRLDLEVTRGDAASVEATVRDSAGDLLDLSSAVWELRTRDSGGRLALTLDARVDDSSAASGVVSFALTEDDTALITNAHTWWLRDTTADRSYLAGKLTALPPGEAARNGGTTTASVVATVDTATVTVTAAVAGGADEAAITAAVTAHDGSDAAHPDIRNVLTADWSVRVFDTGGTVPPLEMYPGADLAAWETATGPALWGIPTDEGVQRVLYADLIDSSRSGVYDYTPTVSWVRSSDADTTAKLNKRAVMSKLLRDHTTTQPTEAPQGWIPNLVLFSAVTPGDPIDTTDWNVIAFTDLWTTQLYNEFLIGIINHEPEYAGITWAIPDPSGEADGRILAVSGGSLVFVDP